MQKTVNRKVSIIITSLNRANELIRLFESIKKQTYSPIETILVDNNSTDNSILIAKKYTKYIYTKGPERSAQRNFGAKQASGRYLFFLDSDMELSPRVINDCVKLIQSNPKIGSIYIPEVSVANNYWERVKAFERSFYLKKGNFYIESARFFTRDAFIKAGGYDSKITGPEDWDLSESIRGLGYHTDRTKSVIYHHEQIPSLVNHAKKFYYYGLRSHRVFEKQKSSLISPKTIHFLRPEFYQEWKRLVAHPGLTLGMLIMIMTQLFCGGAGFIIGKIRNI